MKNRPHLTSLIARTSRLYKTEVNVALKARGINLSSEMCGVLMELWKSDRKSQQELTEIFKKDKAGITRIVKSLEKRELIFTSKDPKDGRRKTISLSSKGKNLQKPVETLIRNLRQEIFTGISSAEQSTAKKVMRQIFANLEKSNQAITE